MVLNGDSIQIVLYYKIGGETHNATLILLEFKSI